MFQRERKTKNQAEYDYGLILLHNVERKIAPSSELSFSGCEQSEEGNELGNQAVSNLQIFRWRLKGPGLPVETLGKTENQRKTLGFGRASPC